MAKKKLKTIYHVECCEIEWFFDEKGKCLGSWYLNDAQYRHEYMNPLLENLGYEVKWLEPKEPLIAEYIKKELLEQGFSEDDME